MIISPRDPLKSVIFSLPMVQLHASLTLGRGKPFQAPPIPRAAKQETRVAMVWWPGGYDKVALRGFEVELVEVALARCA